MQYRFHHIYEASANRVEEHTRKKARLLEKRLSMYPEDLVRLDVRLHFRRKRYGDRSEHGRYEARLVLYFPGPNMAARGYGDRWATAINNAIEDLHDQLEAYLTDLRRESEIREYQRRLSQIRREAEQTPALPADLVATEA